MKKGCEVSGSRYVLSKSSGSMNYHAADKNGRMYLCGCFRGFIVDNQPYYPDPWAFAFKLGRNRNKRKNLI